MIVLNFRMEQKKVKEVIASLNPHRNPLAMGEGIYRALKFPRFQFTNNDSG
jgi:hypothetical protein